MGVVGATVVLPVNWVWRGVLVGCLGFGEGGGDRGEMTVVSLSLNCVC